MNTTARPSTTKLLGLLEAAPQDESLRARAARALELEGRAAEAFQLLCGPLTNLTAHEEGPLPCLCRACLKPAQVSVTYHGDTFHRELAVARGRVLFFWVLDDVPRKTSLTRAVEARLRARLATAQRRRRG